MRYYVTIGKGDAAFQRQIRFEELEDGLRAHVVGFDPEGEAGGAAKAETTASDGKASLSDGAVSSELACGASASEAFDLDLTSLERGRSLHLVANGESHDFYVETLPDGRLALHWRGDRLEVEVVDERELLARSVAGAKSSGPSEVRALMPGVVVSLEVAEGDEVEEGATLLVLEAMKMQNPITADSGGKVSKIHVEPGQAVAANELLMTLA